METQYDQRNSLCAEHRAICVKGDDVATYRFLIIGILIGIELFGPADSVLSQVSQARDPARDVLERFCKLDAQGGQLSVEGWQNVAALFVNPGAHRIDDIMVVRDYVVSRPFSKGDKLGFIVDYAPVGSIDVAEARFSRSPPALQVKGDFVIKRSASQSQGPSDWKIEGPVPEPHITVQTAIRYATELQASARDVAMRKNADKMLAALKRVH